MAEAGSSRSSPPSGSPSTPDAPWNLQLVRGPGVSWRAEATGPGGTLRFASLAELRRWLARLDAAEDGAPPGIR